VTEDRTRMLRYRNWALDLLCPEDGLESALPEHVQREFRKREVTVRQIVETVWDAAKGDTTMDFPGD